MGAVSSSKRGKSSKMAAAAVVACGAEAPLVNLWVERVIRYSSQYNSNTWSADSVIGEPRVYPRYGDIHGAWAQGTCDANQFIEVEFAEKLFIEKVDIYETLNAGAVVKISAKDDSGNWVVLWEKPSPEHITQSRIFSPDFPPTEFSSNQLRMDINCQACATWCEIDAIKLGGKKFNLPPAPSVASMSEDLGRMVNNTDFCDVRFCVEGQMVYGHRVILSARSEYFRAMFKNNLKETTGTEPITIHNVSYTGFLAMMQFLYTNNLDKDLNPHTLVEIIRVADEFLLPGMATFAHYMLAQEINVDNCVDLYRDAVEALPVLENVKASCLSHIRLHMGTVSKTKAFTALPQNIMLDIIQEVTAKLSLS